METRMKMRTQYLGQLAFCLVACTTALAEKAPTIDVVDVAISSKAHSTLVAAVTAADLVTTLKNQGPFTVFAPTNEAFAKLPPGTVDNLLKPENKEKLQDILQYHVSVGVFKEDLLTDGQVIGQANGNDIKITTVNGKPTVNGANIVGAVAATNGRVYVIDKVLLPPG